MFTGIVEALGKISEITEGGTNKTFTIESPISLELKVDQSIAHNGVCLTVEAIANGSHQVTAVRETLSKTNLARWKAGDTINLERCLPMNGRLDGHIVQGHVDALGTLLKRTDYSGSWQLTFSFPAEFAGQVIEKGSISLNGISLTLFEVEKTSFSVAIIPYTYNHTNLQYIEPGDTVNLEFDMIGKYVNRYLSLKDKL